MRTINVAIDFELGPGIELILLASRKIAAGVPGGVRRFVHVRSAAIAET
jgi:hypothetical protein